MTNAERKSLLLDTHWIHAMPVVVRAPSREMQRTATIATTLYVYHLAEHQVRPCFAGMIMSDGFIQATGYMLWNPSPATTAAIIDPKHSVDTLLTPKLFRARGQEFVPDLDSLEVHNFPTMPLDDFGIMATLSEDKCLIKFPVPEYPTKFYRNGVWRNSFIVFSSPIFTMREMADKIQSLCDIRGIDLDKVVPFIDKELRLNTKLPQTRRLRKVISDITAPQVRNQAFLFCLNFKDQEGHHV